MHGMSPWKKACFGSSPAGRLRRGQARSSRSQDLQASGLQLRAASERGCIWFQTRGAIPPVVEYASRLNAGSLREQAVDGLQHRALQCVDLNPAIHDHAHFQPWFFFPRVECFKHTGKDLIDRF